VEITDDMVEKMADEAEKGYDVDEIQRQRAVGRPAMGSGPASVESVRLDPELKKQLLLRASKDGVSVSEVIRMALRSYFRAS
jgi:CRISPR-associated endonuclease/helicase Cas3